MNKKATITGDSLSRKDPSLHHIPPQNIEAEDSLLSAILLDNKHLFEITDIISPEDFYKTAHQKIFTAVLELFTKNEPIDLVTLTNYLREKKQIEDIGGAVYLASLVNSVPMAVNAPHYAKIIYNKSCLRRLIEASHHIAKACYENDGDVDHVIDLAESAVFEVAEKKIKPSFFSLREVIETNIETLEELKGKQALITGVSTGFSKLDSLTSGLQKSDLIILAARPSMGKTALALNIARNAAVEADIPTAIFSLEMSKDQLTTRMLSAEARVDSSRLRSGYFSMEDWGKLTDAGSVLSEAPIYIDDSPALSTMEIRSKARRLKKDKAVGLIVIDYLQLMKAHRSGGPSERRDLEISEISQGLKALAKEIDIPVLALSQLNRKLEERSDKRPMLSDLRESGALEQDADVVVFIYRAEVYNKDKDGNSPDKGRAELIIGKQRNGPIGKVDLTFLEAYTRFENQASDMEFIQ